MHSSRMRTASLSGHLSCHARPSCHTSPPPVDRQTRKKHYLLATIDAGGNNRKIDLDPKHQVVASETLVLRE